MKNANKMKKKSVIIVLIIVVLILGGIFGYHAFVSIMTARYMAHFTMPPSTVNAVPVEQATLQPALISVGTTQAIQGTTISSIPGGQVTKLNFTSGSFVKAGQVLAVLDTGILTAQLQNNIAKVKYDQIQFWREKNLVAQGADSIANYDLAKSTMEQDEATAMQTKSELVQKIVVAPFTGEVGIREVSLGEYLSPGQEITNEQTISPIYVNFTLPDQNVPELYKGQRIEVTADAYPGHVFTGTIHAIDAEVNSSTESIAVQGILANNDPQAMLKPGMFIKVKVFSKQSEQVLVIPQQAVSYTLYGNSVFVVTNSKAKDGQPIQIAKQVPVTVGDQEGNNVVILQGLKLGDLVVTDGQVKLQDGASIKVIHS